MARKNLTNEEWDIESPQEEQDRIEFEKLKAANEKHYRELEAERKAEQERLDRLASTVTGASEVKELEKEAGDIERLTAVDLWMRLFSKISYYNEIPSQCLFHVFVGEVLYEKKIYYLGQGIIDWREFFNWIQDTGTGKGQAFKQFVDLALGFRRPAGDYCTVEKVGRLTNQALINTAVLSKTGMPKIDKDTGDILIKEGTLQNTHFVILEESRQLLQPGKENQEIQEIFMTVCEAYGSPNNDYPKRLMNYSEPVITTSHTGWIGSTRPLGKIQTVLAESGLLQRTLFYPREVDGDTRRKMSEKVSLSISSRATASKFEGEKDKLLSELTKMCEFAHANHISIHPEKEDEVASYLWEKQRWFLDDIEDTVPDSEIKKIIYGFLGRYPRHMTVLSHHSAAMRFSTSVEKQDIEYSFKLMKELYGALKIWVETQVEKDRVKEKESDDYFDLITTYVFSNDGCKISDLIKYVAKRKRVSEQAARYHVKKITDNKKGTLEVRDKRVYGI